jgi:hypothetical protein
MFVALLEVKRERVARGVPVNPTVRLLRRPPHATLYLESPKVCSLYSTRSLVFNSHDARKSEPGIPL